MSSLRDKLREPRAKKLTFTQDAMMIHLADGRALTVPLAWYPRLLHATPPERKNYEIIGEGEYLHWPDLDEDLTVAGLLEGRRSAEQPASIKAWLAARPRSSARRNSRAKRQIRRAG